MDELTVGIAALERAPLFAGLDREDLQKVLGCRQRVSFERGQAIVERWDPGDAMYILVSGAAEVDVGGRFHRLEPVEALRIPADGLQAFLLDNPRVAVGMLKSLVGRLREVQDRLDTWIGGVW